MARTGVLIETQNNEVKETSLGVMTAAAGHEIYALVPGENAAGLKDKLGEYGAAKIVSINAGSDLCLNPDLQASALGAVIAEFELDAVIGTASAAGRDVFARLAASLDAP